MTRTQRWLYEKLAEVCESCPGETIEAARGHIEAGRIMCRIITDGGVPIGFGTYSCGNGLFKVHHVYAEPGRWEVLPKLIDDGKRLMRELGATRMEIMTQKPDVLLRRIAKHGFKRSPYVTLELGGK